MNTHHKITCITFAILLSLYAEIVSACPITLGPYSGSATRPFTLNGTFVKSATTISRSVSNSQTATACSGTHHFDSPSPSGTPNNFTIWAAAAPDGFTGVFYGNSATGRSTDSYTYAVSCGSCPTGTLINFGLRGSSIYNQYAAGVGLAKLTGSASATVSGTLNATPFSGSPFSLGATPATVTASPGAVTATAGSTMDVSLPFTNRVSFACPRANESVNISLTVTASRTGGATSATAAFIDLDYDINTDCQCTARTSKSNNATNHRSGYLDPLPAPAKPVYGDGLYASVAVPANHAEALYAVGDGTLLLANARQSSAPASFLKIGPSTSIMSYQGDAPKQIIKRPFSLISGIIRGTEKEGLFANTNTLVLEGLRWNPEIAAFNTAINSLLIFDDDQRQSSLNLSTPIVMPSGLLFDQSSQSLLVSLPESGQLGQIDAKGKVTKLFKEQALGTPIDLIMAPSNSPFGAGLYVLDNGKRDPDSGILLHNSGRLLRVDIRTGELQVMMDNLNSPVAMVFADAKSMKQGGAELLVMSAGEVNQKSGALIESTGSVNAYNRAGEKVFTVASKLNSPFDMAFRTADILTLASNNQLIDISSK